MIKKSSQQLDWGNLIALTFSELANQFPNIQAERKVDLLQQLLKDESDAHRPVQATGLLEMMADGYGFIKFKQFSYLSSGEDIHVSHQVIRKYQLRSGDLIEGTLKPPRANDKYFGLEHVTLLNGKHTGQSSHRPQFEKLTATYPNRRITLTSSLPKDQIILRAIDLVAPIGFGQRCLIVAPPKAGKTSILQSLAHAVSDNHPDVKLFVLLVDERPEEVTEMKRSVKGEVVSSTFDEQAQRHVAVAEMLLERCKRLVELGHDVVILLDAITRLARAYNTTCPSSGKVLTGGVEANALHKPKRFFGAARNLEEGGSLTIISTALIETNSKMDEVIFEEFKGTGNSEIQLHRGLAERNCFPAININSSGTRRDELLVDEKTLHKRNAMLKILHPMNTMDATELLIKKIKETKSNEEFLAKLAR